MREDIAQRRALHSEPLAAAWLLKLGPERYLWYVRAHHILVDGFGMALIEHRCAALYAHYLGEGSAGMPWVPLTPFNRLNWPTLILSDARAIGAFGRPICRRRRRCRRCARAVRPMAYGV